MRMYLSLGLPPVNQAGSNLALWLKMALNWSSCLSLPRSWIVGMLYQTWLCFLSCFGLSLLFVCLFVCLRRLSYCSSSMPGVVVWFSCPLTRGPSCPSLPSAGTEAHSQMWLEHVCQGAERTIGNKKIGKKQGKVNGSFLGLKFQSK